MSRLVKILAGTLAACFMLAQPASGVQPASERAEDQHPAPKLPKPVRVDPSPMPPLPPAVIDDTLQLGGEDIDAKKVRSRMTVAVEVNGTGPYRFVVDSGADSSVVGKRIAAALKLPLGRPVTLNGMTSSSIVPRVVVDELGLGPTSVSNLELPVLEENDLGGDGMLGIDALVEQRLMMDFEKRLITVEDARLPASRWDGGIIVVTGRRHRGQLILTEIKANGQRVDAVVDTGTEITIGNLALRDAIIRRRGIRPEKIEVVGVTGVTAELELIRVGEIKLGSVTLRNIPIAFADVPPFQVFGLKDQPSLLLGTDLMETFRRVSLDFRARKVRFQLRKCKNTGIVLSTSFSGSMSRIGISDGNEAPCRR